mmetsp:Transcript_26432/g.99387  ORF Transcript_26432/g.99387 Transcript_26432/m.99387 type:complete len:362 (+) Transcript_26432:1023-2108(+)
MSRLRSRVFAARLRAGSPPPRRGTRLRPRSYFSDGSLRPSEPSRSASTSLQTSTTSVCEGRSATVRSGTPPRPRTTSLMRWSCCSLSAQAATARPAPGRGRWFRDRRPPPARRSARCEAWAGSLPSAAWWTRARPSGQPPTRSAAASCSSERFAATTGMIFPARWRTARRRSQAPFHHSCGQQLGTRWESPRPIQTTTTLRRRRSASRSQAIRTPTPRTWCSDFTSTPKRCRCWATTARQLTRSRLLSPSVLTMPMPSSEEGSASRRCGTTRERLLRSRLPRASIRTTRLWPSTTAAPTRSTRSSFARQGRSRPSGRPSFPRRALQVPTLQTTARLESAASRSQTAWPSLARAPPFRRGSL